MRNDDVGMFWEDVKQDTARGQIIRPMPPIPDTGWVAPKEFPRLDAASALSIDTETYDPELLERGPGWARGKGHIVGVSIAVPEGQSWYFPVRHTIQPETNLPPEGVFSWLRDTLGNAKQPKVGANLIYDIGWLSEEGVSVVGNLWDVQSAEALLDERSQVALENLGEKYLGEGKVTEDVYQWCSDFYGGSTKDPRKNLWRAPPCLVGPYAQGDAELPFRVLQKQWPLLEAEGLLELFRMECGIIPLLVAMRRAGVSVDIPRAEQTSNALSLRAEIASKKLENLVGFEVNTNAAESIARAFDHLGVAYGKTVTGKPSFTKDFLESVEHPVAETIVEIRKLEKLRGTFIESYILNSHVNGKVYGQFHALRGDSGGTRSGRLSSSTPNLQNLPSRDEELAPLVRGVFIPDEGHQAFRRYDYSQIEYRFLIHYAIGPGAEEARALFNNRPDTDYHEMALDLVAPAAGWDISTKETRAKKRKPVKTINFGLIYGMGVPTLSRRLGLSTRDGKELFAAYHRGVPFASPTMDAAALEASTTGTVTTILGRKSRFDLWEPLNWGEDTLALPYDKAILKYGSIRRAYTHKALNRRLQGSAADLMKMAMWKCWEGGVFDRTGVPRLTVHDELDFSDPGGLDDAFLEMQHILETAIPLKIPVKADSEIGPDWGHTKNILKTT